MIETDKSLHYRQEAKNVPKMITSQTRSREGSPVISQAGRVDKRLPMVIELFERGEFSAESL